MTALANAAHANTSAMAQMTAAAGQRQRIAMLRGRRGGALAGALLGAFAVLFVLVRTNRSAAADVAVALRWQRVRWPWLTPVMAVISWPGFPPQSRIIPPAAAIGLFSLRLRVEAVFVLAAWGTAFLSTLVKLLMRRPRPEHPLLQVTIARVIGSSFPSGHTLSYVGVYGFLTYLVYVLVRPARLRRLLVALGSALIALVGPSRVYQGHHWPSDVLASYLLGFSYLIGLTALYQRVKEAQAAASLPR